MTFEEFLEMRLENMERELAMHKHGTDSWTFWNARALSYRDALGAVHGTKLIPDSGAPHIIVEPANAIAKGEA